MRRRPGMYVGDTNTFAGIYHLIFEVVGNTVDQYYARAATEVAVDLGPDSWITVRDDGPGIPADLIERIFTTLSTSGTVDGHFPHVHVAAWRGVGLAVVSAVSTRVEVETTRDGVRWAQAFERGEPVTTLRRLGATEIEGTTIRFRPDPTIFRSIELDVGAVRSRLQELAWLLPHLRVFLDERRIHGRGGLVGMARELAGPAPIDATFAIERLQDEIFVDIGIAWAGRDAPRVRSFVNTLATIEDGKHVDGFWQGLAAYARDCGAAARTVSAVRELLGPGLAAAIRIDMIHPKYGNPRKDQLQNPEAATAVLKAVRRSLELGLPYAQPARALIHGRLGVPD
ncbi:MAG: hypothetical protein HOV81_24470 [Kofleriaceae bacterium]|nr:hypothetical protein [Kofleriaceae bacterium]